MVFPLPAAPPRPALSPSPLDDRLLAVLENQRQLTPEATRLLLEVRETFMLGECLALAEWRDHGDRTAAMFAEIKRLELKVVELLDAHAILQERLAFLPPAQRVRFRPEGRFKVVVHARTFGLSLREAARRFLVDENTTARWIREATKNPDATTVGSLLKAVPPIRTVSDVVRETVAYLDRMKVGGSRKIAEFLARSGVRIGRETVRQIRKNPPPVRENGERGDFPRSSPDGTTPAPSGPAAAAASKKAAAMPARAVRAERPNHVWMTDLTTVPTLFGLWSLKVVAFLDVYSLFPFAFQVFWKEPTAEEIVEVLERVFSRFGKPKHFITDQGSQFTAKPFRDALQDRGIQQRFGAIGQTGSIAVIERCWRTMKDSPAWRSPSSRFPPATSPSGSTPSSSTTRRSDRINGSVAQLRLNSTSA